MEARVNVSMVIGYRLFVWRQFFCPDFVAPLRKGQQSQSFLGVLNYHRGLRFTRYPLRDNLIHSQ